MRNFWESEDGFIDLRGIEYFLFAGLGAILGLIIVMVIIFPLSLVWPAAWSAAIWIIGGLTVVGLIWAAIIK